MQHLRTTTSFRRARLALLAAGLTAAAACQGSGAFATLHEDLAGLGDQQTQMLAQLGSLALKVDALENRPVGTLAAAPAGVKPQGPPRPDAAATYKVELGDAHVRGPVDALVTIVAWSDFECSYCKRVGPTMAALKKEYGNDLRVAFKHNPLSFHSRALPAALAAEAAGRQGKFWEMHDKLFENNKDLSDENFVRWAKEFGLDVGQFTQDLTDPVLARKVKKQQAQGMLLGARGTPSFFVNGRFLSGARPRAAFAAIIDEEKKKAEALVARGTPRAQAYAVTIAGGRARV